MAFLAPLLAPIVAPLAVSAASALGGKAVGKVLDTIGMKNAGNVVRDTTRSVSNGLIGASAENVVDTFSNRPSARR